MILKRTRHSRRRMVWLLHSVRKLDRRCTGRLRKRNNLLTVEKGGGEGGAKPTIRRRENLVLYTSFKTLFPDKKYFVVKSSKNKSFKKVIDRNLKNIKNFNFYYCGQKFAICYFFLRNLFNVLNRFRSEHKKITSCRLLSEFSQNSWKETPPLRFHCVRGFWD